MSGEDCSRAVLADESGRGAGQQCAEQHRPVGVAQPHRGGRRGDDLPQRDEVGLALEALPAADVLPRALALADQIAASGPIAVRALKQRLRLDPDQLEEALEFEARAQAESYASADLGEGLAAAALRRPPLFTNR